MRRAVHRCFCLKGLSSAQKRIGALTATVHRADTQEQRLPKTPRTSSDICSNEKLPNVHPEYIKRPFEAAEKHALFSFVSYTFRVKNPRENSESRRSEIPPCLRSQRLLFCRRGFQIFYLVLSVIQLAQKTNEGMKGRGLARASIPRPFRGI